MSKRFFTRKVFKHISKILISLISILQAVKSAIKNTGKKPGPNTEIYGPQSGYGFYGAHADQCHQSECRILQSHIIINVIYYSLYIS